MSKNTDPDTIGARHEHDPGDVDSAASIRQ